MAAKGRGMKNTGNSCFMNAALQALTSIRPLHTFLTRNAIHGPFSKFRAPTALRPSSPLLMALTYTLRELTLSGRSNFDPKKLASVPLLRDNLMKDKDQQDAEELFQILLAAVDDEIEILGKWFREHPPPAPITRKASPLLWGPEHSKRVFYRGKTTHKPTAVELRALIGIPVQIRFETNPFSGQLASTLQCTKCKCYSTLRLTKFNDISLSIPRSGCSLEECLEFFTAIENVNDVECQSCTAQRTATQALLTNHDVMTKGMNGSASLLLSSSSSSSSSSGSNGHAAIENGNGHILSENGNGNGNGFFSSTSSSTSPVKKKSSSNGVGVNGNVTPPLPPTQPVIRVKSIAQKREQFARAPAALCLHLRRLVANSQGMPVKLEYHVPFPLQLNLTPFCLFRNGLANGKSSSSSLPSRHDVIYSLVAVIVHHGSAFAGHYTVYRRVPTRNIPSPKEYEEWVRDDSSGGSKSKWIHFSDENVTPVSEETVLSAQAYMIFYERVGDVKKTSKKTPSLNGV